MPDPVFGHISRQWEGPDPVPVSATVRSEEKSKSAILVVQSLLQTWKCAQMDSSSITSKGHILT